jgi:hypothetical protein
VAAAKVVQEAAAARDGMLCTARACRRNLAFLGEKRTQQFGMLDKMTDANNASSRVLLQERPPSRDATDKGLRQRAEGTPSLSRYR